MTTLSQLDLALADRYRIERELGAGGMATVYLAHDLKHDRKVALKVLKPELAAVLGADRFIVEIKTTAALQHPHILPLFDSGSADGFLFYVMPFIDGETLRAKLDRETQLGVDEAVKIACDVAEALEYAHRHGVIHRDIKPENILLQDGRPMVADFGIALAVSAAAGGRMTETGLSLGTPHYMSPEQATAEKEITGRSDIYSLASVLYEMLTGDPPHTGSSAQQIIMKIVTEEAAPVTRTRKSVPPNVAAAVAKALERLPADRFEHAKDFADALNNPGFGVVSTRAGDHTPRRAKWTWALAGVVAGAVIAAVGVRLGWFGVLTGRADENRALDRVSFIQRTFSTEAIFTARFARDGETVVYSAASEGSVPRLYVVRSDYPEPQPVGDPATHLLSISSTGELAVLVRATFNQHRVFTGTLARMPMGGGAPRELLADVRDADWAPNGSDLAIIRRVAGQDRLEYPVGKVLYQSSGYLSDPRFSRAGDRIAFFEHPAQWDDRGGVAIVDLNGHARTLTDGYWGLEGLAWAPDGVRLVYGAAVEGGFYQIHSVTLAGETHLMLPSAGTVTVQDVSPAGHWLVTRDDLFSRMMVKTPGAQVEHDLSWLDNSAGPVISQDGALVAFADEAADAGSNYATMIRKIDGSPATRLGEGGARDISPDKQWVLSVVLTSPAKLVMYPTGPGQPRVIAAGLQSYGDVKFFHDGKSLLICGNEPAHAARCYARPIDGGPLRPITPEGTSRGWISPNGQIVLSQGADGRYSRYTLDGAPAQPASALTANDEVVQWTADGKALLVTHVNELPVRVERVDLSSGRRTLLSTVAGSRSGLLNVTVISFSSDEKSYAYLGAEYVSHIFEVRGMR